MSFFLIFHKHPILSCRYFVKKRQFCQNQNTWWAIKVQKMPFFLILYEKIAALIPIFSHKYVYSLKNTLLSSSCIMKKRLFSQKHCAHVLFFQVFYEKPPAVKPIYGQKDVKSVKITLFWAKKDNRMPFFSDFSQKNNCSNL